MAASNSYRKPSVAPVGAAIDTVGSSLSTTVSSTAAGAATAVTLGVAVSSIVTSPSSTSLSTASTVSVADAVVALATKVNVVPSGNSIRSESVVSATVNPMSWTGFTVAVTVTVSPPSSIWASDSVSVTVGLAVPCEPSTLWFPCVLCSAWVRLAGRLLLDAVRMRSSASSFNVRDWSPTQMPSVSSSAACTL